MPIQRYETKDKAGKTTGAGFAVHLMDGTLAALLSVPLAAKAPPAKGLR